MKVNNIAYIQDLNLLTDEQVKKYMGNIKYLTSEDPERIYKFIVCCNRCYNITNFCLNINSRVLIILNTLISDNRNLDSCIFIATRSNANDVRDIISKNIYFSLSSLDVILQNYSNIEPNIVMTIVSDVNSAFYNQIYETGPKPAYRISELTIEKINEFSITGVELLISLNDNDLSEFEKLNSILLNPACEYYYFATFIEIENNNLEIVNNLNSKLYSVDSIASNVSLSGLIDLYPDINQYTLYQNCSIQFVGIYNSWPYFIKNGIIFNRFTLDENKIKTKKIISSGVLTTYQTIFLSA
jgi:ABC-type glucose/galactose transport system permease subunit